jgi:hypothetical protein
MVRRGSTVRVRQRASQKRLLKAAAVGEIIEQRGVIQREGIGQVLRVR